MPTSNSGPYAFKAPWSRNDIRATYVRIVRSIRTSMKHLLGSAAGISCLLRLRYYAVIGYQFTAKWWQFAVRRYTQAPVEISGPANLERWAEKLEREGKLEEAMSKLMESHAAGSSNAGKLAHELSRRYPEAFDVTRCPMIHAEMKTSGATSGAPEENRSLLESSQTLPPSSQGYPLRACRSRHVVTDVSSATADPCLAFNFDSRTRVDPGDPTTYNGQQEQLRDLPGTNVVTDPKLQSDRVADVPYEYEKVYYKENSAALRQAIEGETPWKRGWQAPKEFAPPPESDNSVSTARVDDMAGLRNFTVAQLNVFDGSMDKGAKRGGVVRAGKARPIYIALGGTVYDASTGRHLYGQGGEYSELAGHDVSRRVARGLRQSSSQDGDDGDLDDLSLEGMGRFEEMTLNGWEDVFTMRGYPVVGRVVTTPSSSRVFSREELRAFRGGPVPAEQRGGYPMPRDYAVPPIYVGVMDRVFDVSFGGADFYTEGGPYECLAGRDASRVLAKMSMSPEDIGGKSDYSGLTRKEHQNLTDWVKQFENKGYPVVGRLILCGFPAEQRD